MCCSVALCAAVLGIDLPFVTGYTPISLSKRRLPGCFEVSRSFVRREAPLTERPQQNALLEGVFFWGGAASNETRVTVFQRNGCLGIIARRWRGSPRPPPRNMIIPSWPKRIDCGHGWVTCRNAHKTGLSNGKIR